MPLRYSAGIKASMLGARRAYRGKIALVNFSPSRRSFTRGCRTGTLPTPVTSSRSGWEPLRTTWRWSCASRFGPDYVFHLNCRIFSHERILSPSVQREL